MSRRLAAICAFALLAGAAGSGTAGAWTAESRVAMADFGSSIAPADLERQIERHRRVFHQGVRSVAPGAAGRPELLPQTVRRQAEAAVGLIESHRPFADIVRQLGVVAALLAEANDPLAVADGDPQESLYRDDWRLYSDGSRGRFAVLFYGQGRDIGSGPELAALVERSLERGRQLYPLIGAEYRRVGTADGLRLFDDKSSAFGVASISFSQAVSDITGTLRYIWIRAGGADRPGFLPFERDLLVLLRAGARTH